MKNNIIIKIFLVAVFFIISLTYLLSAAGSLLDATLYLAVPLIYVAAGFYATRLYGHGSNTGDALFFISLGASCWLLGEVIWYAFKFFLDMSPFPSVADVFFLLAYPLFFVAIYRGLEHIRTEWRHIRKTTLIFNGVAALFLTAVVAYWGIYSAYSPAVGKWENIFAMSYGVADLFLVVGVLWAASLANVFGEGKLGRFWNIMAGGFLLFLVADILFAIYQVDYTNDLKPYIYIDIIWIAGYLVLAYGLLENASLIKAIKDKIGDGYAAAERLK